MIRSTSRGTERNETGGERRAGAGSVPVMAAAVLAGGFCWFKVLPELSRGPQTPAAGAMSVLSEVAADELEAAVATLEPTSPSRTQARAMADKGCPYHLAWVALSQPADASPGTVRIISGTYASPVFPTGATSARIAIPYPAPYETGRGTLTLLDAGGPAVVALTPPVHVVSRAGGTTRTVTWQPLSQQKDARCPRGGS